MKDFTTAVPASKEPDAGDLVSFKLDGQEFTAIRPTPEQLAFMLAGYGRFASDSDKIAAAIDLFTDCMAKDSRDAIIKRLLDREDPLDLEVVTNILQWLIETWTNRPFQPSADSSPLQTAPTGSSMESTSATV